MGTEVFLAAVVILMLFAALDLIVGVSNDAVNFLNSSIGSRVAPFKVIMIIASLGILAGVTFSSGMMEVARKGIFHPQLFTMPDLIILFLAVMLTDILLLDMFNTFGLPTSTTVSIVFELLGAAVAVSLIKIAHLSGADGLGLGDYINTSKALTIIFGILLSIVVAFVCGSVFQFLTRLLFTFNYQKRIKRFGAIWGGLAMASITFFILVKGSKGASFMTEAAVSWIASHNLLILFMIFAVTAVLFQILITLFRVNVFKPVVLVGTFALAMAFAANDLVNFIGVPLAGMSAYINAMAAEEPLNVLMVALSKPVKSNTFLLLIAGGIMVVTLWVSRKARSVTETEISLGQQDEGLERFESIWLSRTIVRMTDSMLSSVKSLFPEWLRSRAGRRLDPSRYRHPGTEEARPSFDLVRASVNLMVASMVVSMATSMKLPLSTTYVTFMVAMGTSFADRAWGRESAVYRITGVLTVVGGWFMTALIAFGTSFLFAGIIYYLKIPGAIGLMAFAGYTIWRHHKLHESRVKERVEVQVFTMGRVTDAREAVSATFDHLAFLLKETRGSLEETFEALFQQDLDRLAVQRKKVKRIQLWSNIITANIFKVLRLLQKEERRISTNYSQIIRRLQRISDGHRDFVLRAYMHVANKHKGLTQAQIQELKQVKGRTLDILARAEAAFRNKDIGHYQNMVEQFHQMRTLEDQLNTEQIERIGTGASETRQSVLYYALIGNCILIAKQNIKLLRIFNESFKFDEELSRSYIQVEPH